jgi:hypothetical protein
LRFPRPDVSVATGPIAGNQILTETGFQAENSMFIDGVSPFSGNTQGDLNTASNTPPNIQVLFPYIYTVTPDSGSQSGGNLVTLMGENFTDVTTVRFGGTVASFSLVNSTQIVATAPAYPVTGIVDISVEAPFGTATKHGGYTYTAASAPIVLGITPNNGTISGGTPVTITGSNFIGATEVKIGTLPSYSFVVVNSNTITTTTVPYSVGPVNVTVTTPYGTGTGANLFTYTNTQFVEWLNNNNNPVDWINNNSQIVNWGN